MTETFYRLSSRPPIGVADPRPLRLGQLSLEFSSLMSEIEKALPPIMWAWSLLDESLANQMTKNAAQALLGNPQSIE